jgi:FixJ family two-component response regulator
LRPGTGRPILSPWFRRSPGSVAILDDDELMRGALQGLLKEADCLHELLRPVRSSCAPARSTCLRADRRRPYAGMSGLDLQARLDAEQIRIPIIFITAHGDERMRTQALRAGAADFLAKPFDDEVLLRSVRAVLEM